MRALQLYPVLWLICFLFSLLLYAPVLKSFLIWDDVAILPWIAPAGLQGWINCFLPMDTGFVRPAPLLAFKLCWEIAGTKPQLYHLISLAIHAAVAAMTGLVAARLLQQWRWVALVASLMMAGHFGAYHVGAQLSNSCDSIAALGILFAVYHWDKWLAGSGTNSLFLVAAGCILGISGKEHAVLTPILLLLWTVGRERLNPTTGRMLLWFGLAAGVIGACMLWLQVTSKISYVNTGEIDVSDQGRLPRFFNLIANTYVPYLSTVQWPINKTYSSTELLRFSRRLAALLVIAAALATAVRSRYRMAGALIMCAAVLVLPVVPIRSSIMGRYLYTALPFSILGLLYALASTTPVIRTVGAVLLVQLWAVFLFSFRWSPTPNKFTRAAKSWSKFVSSVDKERANWPPLSTITVYTNFTRGGKKHIPTPYGMAIFRAFFPDMVADYVSNKKLPRTTHVYRFDGHRLILLQEESDAATSELD